MLKLFHTFPNEHFSADQVYRRLSNEPEPCSLASVYRALSQLHEAALITSTSLGEARVIYELNRGERHNHLVCSRCGLIQDAYDPNLELQHAQMAADLNFLYLSSNVVIFGRCAQCSGSSAASRSPLRRS